MALKLVKRDELPDDLFPSEPPTKKSKASTKLLEWAGAKVDADGKLKARTKRKTVASSCFNRARVETQEMMDSRDWSRVRARHFLALFDLMHEKVYGIAPSMTGAERYTFTLRVGGFVQREFGGDYEKAVDYFRWVWMREMEREAWRRREGREPFCLSFGMTISGKSITDYRVALLRKRA